MFGLMKLLALAITVLVLLVVSCNGKMQVPQPSLQNKRNGDEEDSIDVRNIESAIDGFAGNRNFTTTEGHATLPRLDTNAKFSAWGVVRESLKRGMPGAFSGLVQVLSFMWLRTIISYQARYGLSLRDSARSLWKQGGIMRFYDGLTFAIIQQPLTRFGMAATLELVEMLSTVFPATLTLPVTACISSISAGLWRAFLTPLDVCKVVLQVEGSEGWQRLKQNIKAGRLARMYSGVVESALATGLANYPWHITFQYLQQHLPEAHGLLMKSLRNGVIGFVSSVSADIVSNGLKVIKIAKQTSVAGELGEGSGVVSSYMRTLDRLLKDGGMLGLLFGRGLSTRILANGLQSIVFTIIWRALRDAQLATKEERRKHVR